MAIALLKNPDERNDPPRPLMEHFYALRDMLVFMVVSWVICFTIAAFNSYKNFVGAFSFIGDPQVTFFSST